MKKSRVLWQFIICALIVFLVAVLILGILAPSRHMVSKEKIEYTVMENIEIDSNDGAIAECLINSANILGSSICIEAEISHVFTDVYSWIGVSSGTQKSHILELSVKDVIIGENVPETIYYLLPAYLSVEFDEFSSFIITVEQIGIEGYAMLNETTGHFESFDFMFCSTGDFAFHRFGYESTQRGTFLPFSNGIFNPVLWEKEGWSMVKTYMDCEWERDSGHPIKYGMRIEDAKAAIKNVYASFFEWEPSYFDYTSVRVTTKADFLSLDSLEIVNQVQPFKNGVYLQRASLSVPNYQEIVYHRAINGFETNEYYYLAFSDDQGKTCGKSKFELIRYNKLRKLKKA